MTANYCDGDDHAYPHGEHGQILGGLTKRELFAAMAMQSILSKQDQDENVPSGRGWNEVVDRSDRIARKALRAADALIAELSK